MPTVSPLARGVCAAAWPEMAASAMADTAHKLNVNDRLFMFSSRCRRYNCLLQSNELVHLEHVRRGILEIDLIHPVHRIHFGIRYEHAVPFQAGLYGMHIAHRECRVSADCRVVLKAVSGWEAWVGANDVYAAVDVAKGQKRNHRRIYDDVTSSSRSLPAAFGHTGDFDIECGCFSHIAGL